MTQIKQKMTDQLRGQMGLGGDAAQNNEATPFGGMNADGQPRDDEELKSQALRFEAEAKSLKNEVAELRAQLQAA